MAKGQGKSRRIRSADSETNRYLNQLRREGYLLEMSGGGHWKIYLKCGKPNHEPRHCSDCDIAATTSASPSVRILHKLMRDVEAGTQAVLERREQKRVDCS